MGSDRQRGRDDPRAHRISIHAPRMGSDWHSDVMATMKFAISIHAPRMGSDVPKSTNSEPNCGFQSTLPGWGATRPTAHQSDGLHHFNPRSPDGERPVVAVAHRLRQHFNPRSPDGERLIRCRVVGGMPRFQSTLPGWGATNSSSASRSRVVDFNPRSPDGERLARP